MNPPHLKFTLRDEARNINYVVWAYREITRDELVAAVRAFRSSKAGRRVRKNTNHDILTVIGATE